MGDIMGKQEIAQLSRQSQMKALLLLAACGFLCQPELFPWCSEACLYIWDTSLSSNTLLSDLLLSCVCAYTYLNVPLGLFLGLFGCGSSHLRVWGCRALPLEYPTHGGCVEMKLLASKSDLLDFSAAILSLSLLVLWVSAHWEKENLSSPFFVLFFFFYPFQDDRIQITAKYLWKFLLL